MTPTRAAKLSPEVTSTLERLTAFHGEVELIMGKDYLQTIDFNSLSKHEKKFSFVGGSIGLKLNRLHGLLRGFQSQLRMQPCDLPRVGRPLYFLPDWDDFLDVDYDFSSDRLSSPNRNTRKEEHSIGLMRPSRLCDGVLISLAQHLGSKGLLKRVPIADEASLAPVAVRQHFKLDSTQWAFGDCGAFSYSSEDRPAISVERAVSVYDLYEFDLGASVDHIPLSEIRTEKGKVKLTDQERRARVRITRDNAERFLEYHRVRGARFIPVGVIQGLLTKDYAEQIPDYLDMGYRYIAFGGLVPRSDAEVLEIVEAVRSRIATLKCNPWTHLFGIFRPGLQEHFRRLGINSFDSATYFRKAWLRSDQNYLGCDGKWYAAIRIPPTSDPRTLQRLKLSGVAESKIRQLEEKAIAALYAFDNGEKSLRTCLKAITEYDKLLSRSDGAEDGLLEAYKRTLENKPWKQCECQMCQSIGINVLVFRGLNRNKRRGAHNTLQLFKKLDHKE